MTVRTTHSSAQRSNAIDALRGVAVIAVVLAHLPFSNRTLSGGGTDTFPESPVPEILEFGRFGVHLFLIISGFCIHARWAEMRNDQARIDFVTFWKRRLARLLPPYGFTLILTLVGLWIATRARVDDFALGYNSPWPLALDLLSLAFFFQNLTGASQRIGNGPLWSLALEEQLYLLYFPMIGLRKRWGWNRTLLVTGIVTVAWRAAVAGMLGESLLLTAGLGFWCVWCLGALASEVSIGRQVLPKWCSSPLTAMAMLSISVATTQFLSLLWARLILIDLMWAASCFFVVLAANRHPTRILSRQSVLGWIGEYSYSIYLTHVVVMIGVKQAVLPHLGNIPTLLIRLLAPFAAAAIMYRLIEKPAHTFARRIPQATSTK